MAPKALKIYLTAGLLMFCLPHPLWNNLYAVLYALAGLGMYLVLCRREKLRPLPPLALGIGVPVFLGICFLRCLWAFSRPDALRVAIFYLAGFVLAYLTAAAFSGPENREPFYGALHAVLLVTAVYGLAEYSGGDHTYFTLVGDKLLVRLCSTLEHPINYGEFTALLFPLCLVSALRDPRPWRKALRLAALLPPLAALALTFSRTGWLALAVSLLLLVWLRNRKWLLPALALAVAAVLLAPADIRSRALSMLDFSAAGSSGRFILWRECFGMLKGHWLTGIGLGTRNFAQAYAPYATGTLWFPVPHANMLYLDIFLSLGLFGFAAFLCFFFGIFFRLFRSGGSELISALAGFAAASVFEQTFFYPRVFFAWCLVFGLACAASGAKPFFGASVFTQSSLISYIR